MISVVSAVAVMLVALGFSSHNTSAGEQDYDLNAMAEEIALLVNEARTELGLKPVYVVPYLNDVAQLRSRECVETFDHRRPDGTKFITAIDYSLVHYGYASENIAAGLNTPEATFEQWKNSSGHWANITNPSVTHLGVGVCYEPNSTYRWYWTQIFVACEEGFKISGQYIPERYKVVPKATGDLSGNGCVDTFDYIMLLQYLDNKSIYLNDLQVEAADCLKDGSVTSADAMILKQFLLGKNKDLPYELG
ncbi:MAG: SCP-like extracellular [Ruminococcus sp.]|nr:SCP-like extracellular [Ruminococcus sp.]